MIARVLRERGRPCRLHRDCRPEPGLPTPGRSTAPLSRASGDEQGTNRWYRQTKETKCGEMDGKESECPIVASKRGNGPYRTPWSEGGAALWTRRRNHAEDTVPHQRVTARRWIV
jgi:hypothetical protein